MEKINYHRQMQQIFAMLPTNAVSKLLLHSCCGPCSTAVLEQLTPHFEIVLFFYNPNIAPQAEYEKRLETQKQLLQQLNSEHPITLLAPAYDDRLFWEAVKGVEDTPEMGERCERCIRQRMEEAAKIALVQQCDWFTTTLSVSPHKNASFINACGLELEQQFGVRFLPSDFKKGGGYAKSVALSREYQLYRQDYCGCPMSLQETEHRRFVRTQSDIANIGV